MTFLRFLNVQGIAGIAVSLCLSILLGVQKIETGRWKKQSTEFEQRYRIEQANSTATVANYRAAAEAARAADLANAQRAAAEQQAINQRSENALESRLADARDRAEQLRVHAATTAANSGGRAGASVPRLPNAPSGTAQATGKDGLPAADALTATEQAIQLDELIKWVKAQAKVDNNGSAVASPAGD